MSQQPRRLLLASLVLMLFTAGPIAAADKPYRHDPVPDDAKEVTKPGPNTRDEASSPDAGSAQDEYYEQEEEELESEDPDDANRRWQKH